jgi:hypothetical protein
VGCRGPILALAPPPIAQLGELLDSSRGVEELATIPPATCQTQCIPEGCQKPPSGAAARRSGGGVKLPPSVAVTLGWRCKRVISDSCPCPTHGVSIVRAFVKIREHLAASAVVLKRLAEIDKTLLLHDATVGNLSETSAPARGRLRCHQNPSFHIKEDALPYRLRKKPVRA